MIDFGNLWPWISLALLGGFHGLNPAMGWLFAVALGFQERKLAAVVFALGPIALGHALAIACVAVPVGLLQIVIPQSVMLILGGLALVLYAAYKVATRLRHPRWVGMRVGPLELVSWSALMAAAHGAGLMLIPALASLSVQHPPSAMASTGYGAHHHMDEQSGSLVTVLAAVSLHTFSMLLVMGIIAVVVYQRVGVEILRRAWINLDLIWTGALVATGGLTLALGLWPMLSL